jgi:trans-aconitate methyltransferase
VGGGESRLIDTLLAEGLDCLAVLDVSHEALEHARARIGAPAHVVTWIESDVTGAWSLKPMDIWHDRAVFHFLVEADDRLRYLTHLRKTLKVNGGAIIATFAPDGPDTCSGLPVARYSPDALAAELGDEFRLMESRQHPHITPSGTVQSFQYSRFQRIH